MKLLTAGAAALIVLTAGASAPAAFAQAQYKTVTVNQNGKKVVRKTVVRPNGTTRTVVRRKWTSGQRLPASYYGSNYAVDYRRYKLRAPPSGHRWVRRDNQFLLVAIGTGAIVSAIAASQ